MPPLGPRHHHVQRVRRLLRKRALRDEQGVAVIEGANLLTEALAAGIMPELVLVGSGAPADVVDRVLAAGGRVHPVADGVIDRIGSTVSPQPVVAVVPLAKRSLADLDPPTTALVAVEVRDPGNGGTLLRSAEAAGVGAVVFCGSSVDIHNPKTLRASAGSIFHVPTAVGGEVAEAMAQVAGWGLKRVGAVAAGGRPIHDVDLTGPVALVVGNEAHGFDGSATDHLDELVTIPIVGRAESLNVSMAATVAAFEMARQRAGTA